MTDKELKKLSRLELLELLLEESRENERLKSELNKLRDENNIQISTQNLNEASAKMNESLENARVLTDALKDLMQEAPMTADKKTSVGPVEKNTIFTKENNSTGYGEDAKIYSKLLLHFHKNAYALTFLPEDIRKDVEKRLEEITRQKN